MTQTPHGAGMLAPSFSYKVHSLIEDNISYTFEGILKTNRLGEVEHQGSTRDHDLSSSTAKYIASQPIARRSDHLDSGFTNKAVGTEKSQW